MIQCVSAREINMLDKTETSKAAQFNPKGPKVSTRRARKSFGRDTMQAAAAREYELNYRTEAHDVSLAQLEALYAGKPVTLKFTDPTKRRGL